MDAQTSKFTVQPAARRQASGQANISRKPGAPFVRDLDNATAALGAFAQGYTKGANSYAAPKPYEPWQPLPRIDTETSGTIIGPAGISHYSVNPDDTGMILVQTARRSSTNAWLPISQLLGRF